MVSKQCERDHDNNVVDCNVGNINMSCDDREVTVSEDINYDSNLGFAKADSLYEAPEIIDTIPTPESASKRKNDSEYGGKSLDNNRSKNNLSDKKNKSTEENYDNRKTELVRKQTKHMEKKLAAQRKQRLYEELKNRLKDEQQESLTRYMYQGLNNDIVEDQEEPRRKKHRRLNLGLAALGISVVLLIATGILFYLGSNSEHADYSFVGRDAIEVYSSQTNSKTYVFNAKGDMLYKLEGYHYFYYTPDHTAAILYNWNSRYCAYVNAFRVKEFRTAIYNFALSEDGNYIAYSIPGGANKFYLMLYDITNDTETMIDNQSKRFDLLNVLPGGKTISYVTYDLSENGSIKELNSYIIQNNGKPELFGENMVVFRISFDLSSIYYGTYSDGNMRAVYVRHNGEDRKLSDGINGNILTNKDYTEIMVENEGSYYLSRQGEEPQMIVNQLINYFILPDKGVLNRKMNGIVSYGFQSFAGKLLLCNNNSIIYLDDKLQLIDIGVTGDEKSVMLSKDGKTLFFLDQEQRLTKVTDIRGNITKEVIADEVSEFKLSNNMSQIYYLRDRSLYFQDKDREERLIGDNVRGLSSNANKDTVFFLKDYTGGKGTLYYSQDGSAAMPVEGGSNVSGLKEWNFGVIYQKFNNGSSTVFYNREGRDFVFILDGLNLLEDGVVY